jgi:hypothetical protein
LPLIDRLLILYFRYGLGTKFLPTLKWEEC